MSRGCQLPQEAGMCQVKVGRLLLARADRRTRVSKGLSPLARMQGRVALAEGGRGASSPSASVSEAYY